MKKFIAMLALSLLAVNSVAAEIDENTNPDPTMMIVTLEPVNTSYTSVEQCQNAMADYAKKAGALNQSSLQAWFTSFSNDNTKQRKCDRYFCKEIVNAGCVLLGVPGMKPLWPKAEAKLRHQIAQLQHNLPSIYGEQVSVVCQNPAGEKHSYDYCQ